jgi:hypothetical protein
VIKVVSHYLGEVPNYQMDTEVYILALSKDSLFPLARVPAWEHCSCLQPVPSRRCNLQPCSCIENPTPLHQQQQQSGNTVSFIAPTSHARLDLVSYPSSLPTWDEAPLCSLVVTSMATLERILGHGKSYNKEQVV